MTQSEAKTLCGSDWLSQRKDVVKFVNGDFPAKCIFPGSPPGTLKLIKKNRKVVAVLDGPNRDGKRLVKSFSYGIVNLGNGAGYAVCFNEGVQGLKGVVGGPCIDRK